MNAISRTASIAVLVALGLALAVAGAESAAAIPLGHADFLPTAKRPIGFRGDGSGHFPGATPPESFSEKEGKNIRWSLKMPGWGQSSPIVVGKRVIAAAEPDTTLCVDADTGKLLWQDALGVFPKLVLDPDNPRESDKYVFLWMGNGYSWPCSDGRHAIKAWIGGKGSPTAAIVGYDLVTGKRLWWWQFSGDTKRHTFARDGLRWAWKKDAPAEGAVQHTVWEPTGYASPQLFEDTVIYHARRLQCSLVALDVATGALRWVSEPNVFGNAGVDANFLILPVGPRRVLVTNIGTVLDPQTGKTLGEAIPSVEKDGRRISRLWGPLEKGPRGEVDIRGIAPVTGLGTDGLVAFGPDWPLGNGDGGDQGGEPSGAGAYHYLAAKIGFDAQGKLATTWAFPQRATVPKLEYGNAHLTIVKDRLLVLPGYGSSLAAIALDTGELVIANRELWRAKRQKNKGNIRPDPAVPETRAGLEEFGLSVDAVTEPNRGIGRNGYSSYSRTFVDGGGRLWYMNRQAQIYRIDPQQDFDAELAGSLAHPDCWTTNSSPVPHGNRIYVRTFGRLTCIGEK